MFKHFNDYIVKLPFDSNYQYISSDNLPDKYFTYQKPEISKYVVIRDTISGEDYVIDIDTSGLIITENGISNN